MNKKILIVLSIILPSIILFLTNNASPDVPIQLLTDEVNKLKFVNYEKWYDDGDWIMDTGDYFEGIFKAESIRNISGSSDLSSQLMTTELTGHFKFSVIGGSHPLNGPGHADLALLAGSAGGGGVSDFIRFYTDETPDWDPTGGGRGLAAAIGFANNGNLWTAIEPGEGNYEGIVDGYFQSWANFILNIGNMHTIGGLVTMGMVMTHMYQIFIFRVILTVQI